MYSTPWAIATIVRKMDMIKDQTPPSTVSGSRTIRIRRNGYFWTAPQEIQRKPLHRRFHRYLLQTWKGNCNKSDHDHKYGLYIPSRLDYLIRDTHVRNNRQWHAVHQQVLRNAAHVSWHETYDNNRLSTTNQWAAWKTQQSNCDTPSRYGCQPPTRLRHIWSAVDICMQNKSTKFQQHNTYQSRPVTQSFWATILQRYFCLFIGCYYFTESQALQAQLLKRIKALRKQTDTTLATAQKQYKRDCDKTVRRTPVFLAEQLVYMYKPQLATSSVRNADETATTTYNKLILKPTGPFSIIEVSCHTLIIIDDGLHITMSVLQETLALAHNDPSIFSRLALSPSRAKPKSQTLRIPYRVCCRPHHRTSRRKMSQRGNWTVRIRPGA